MIKLENCEVVGWEHAIRGMRNPKNSWARSDSDYHARRDLRYCDNDIYCFYDEDGVPHVYDGLEIGPNDHKLMMQLASGGPVHAKYRRMITVYVDITAPLYWWKEFDTYKVGTVANSCSTMHKLADKEFTLDDFSHEDLLDDDSLLMDNFESMYYEDLEKGVKMELCGTYFNSPLADLKYTVDKLNICRRLYLDKSIKGDRNIYFKQMIQLLPSSYNQKRTIMLNYEVLVGIYKWRKDHKLSEWREFCKWIESLPYSEIITGAVEEAE